MERFKLIQRECLKLDIQGENVEELFKNIKNKFVEIHLKLIPLIQKFKSEFNSQSIYFNEDSNGYVILQKSRNEIGHGVCFAYDSVVKLNGRVNLTADNCIIQSKQQSTITCKNSEVVAADSIITCFNSKVKSVGNSIVKAFEKSEVEAFQNSQVTCSDSVCIAYNEVSVNNKGTAYLYDNSTCKSILTSKTYANDKSSVKCSNNSCVIAKGNSKVFAIDNCKVELYEDSSVNCTDNVVVEKHSETCFITKSGNAKINVV